MKRLAYIISRAYDPGILLATLILITVLASSLNVLEKIVWIIVLELIIFIFPLYIFFHLIRLKKISDIDITHKEERLPLFRSITLLWLGAVLLAVFFQLPKEIVTMNTIGFLIISFYTLISPYFKISAHIAGVTGFVFLCYFVLQVSWMIWFGPIFILIIGWSRFVQKKHSIIEMLSAFLLTTLLVVLVVKIML